MWSFTWLIIPVISILILGFATWRIIKAVKKHKTQKQAPTSSKNAGKVKGQKRAKQKIKTKNHTQQNKAEKTTNKNSSQNQTVMPRHNSGKPQNTDVKNSFPRFDIQDANIVAKDKKNFLRHQKLFFKHNKTNEEKEEFLQLEKYFAKTYGHVPNQNLPADYTQTGSGFYCFNGNGSQNFKKYCESTPYNKEKDNGDRLIVQINCGNNRKKLSFCINKNDKDMLNAAMQDIDSTITAINATNAVVNIATIEQGKFKVLPEKTYKDFCKKDEKKATATKQETPELSK